MFFWYNILKWKTIFGHFDKKTKFSIFIFAEYIFDVNSVGPDQM